MKDNIIRDISTLYELSLSIGESVNIKENCNIFLKQLMAKKSLDFVSVWIKNKYLPGKPDNGMASLIYANPEVNISENSIPVLHPVFKAVEFKDVCPVYHTQDNYYEMLTENFTEQGNLILFRLGDFGVLKLHSSRDEGMMDKIEISKLIKVIRKFTASLEANLSHEASVFEAEERMKSEQQHKLLFDHNPLPMIIIEVKTYRIMAANDAFKNKYGFRFSELKTMSASAFIPGDIFTYSSSITESSPADIEEVEWRNKKKSGEDVDVTICARIMNFKGVEAALVLINDITQSKRIQKDIRESEKKYRGIFETLSDVYAEVSLGDATILEITPSIKKISGYTREQLIGKKLTDFYANIEERSKLISELFKNNGVLYDYEVMLKNKYGHHIPTSFSIHLQYDQNGDPEKIVGTMRDISYRKRAENELKEAKERAEKADKAKSTFLATMSHEIRNPMSAIIGNLNIMADKGIPETLKKYHKRIGVSADNLLQIINNILDFSKIEAGEFNLDYVPLDLKTDIEKLVASLQINADTKSLKINCIVDPRIRKQIIGDKQRINQIITNLVSNAIKFTEKGEVSVNCTLVNESDEHYEILFQVSDTGIGIDDAKQEEIFESFKQEEDHIYSKYGGTGLGLAITKSLVSLMGGNIKVNSHKGEGSTFYFTLEFNIRPYSSATNSFKREKIKLFTPGLKVLLVEDDPLNMEIGYEILVNEGCSVDIATDGLEAIQKNKEKQYDLILMDLRMPNMGGIEATRILREKLKSNVPIIALTAEAVKETLNSCFDAGMDGYMLKPFKKEELIQKMNGLLAISDNDKQKFLKASKILSGKKCLIVDDDETIIEITQNILAQHDCNSDLAFNGIEAIKSISMKKYDFILMDLNMPEMDGITATRIIRKKFGNDPVIIGYSSNDNPKTIRMCKEEGMDDLILKSPDSRNIIIKIAEIIEIRNLPDSQDSLKTGSDNGKFYDLSILERTFGNNEAMIRSSLQKFLEITPGYLERMNKYYSEGDLDRVSDMAHIMKSSFVLLRIESLMNDLKIINNLKYDKTLTHEVEDSLRHINELFPVIVEQMEQDLRELCTV